MMITKEMVYEEKRQFVKKLEEALLYLDEIRGIEYRASTESYIELVRIDWHGEGAPHEYINVTLNSLKAILKEVMSLIQEGWAIGQIRNPWRGDELWKELGEAIPESDEQNEQKNLEQTINQPKVFNFNFEQSGGNGKQIEYVENYYEKDEEDKQ